MCGIVGIWNFNHQTVDPNHFNNARDSMLNRGPDQCGTWLSDDNRIALGHRRLSIIDPSEGANQPLVDPENGNILVFNGEIYNFKNIKKQLEDEGCTFRTNSDSETILIAYRMWGSACLERFVGMFAFCIFDRNKNQFFLARDRFGVKPLFYSSSSSRLIFSSRIEPMLSLRNQSEINIDSVRQHVEMGWVSGTETLIKDVYKLEPGHFLIVDNTEIKITKYWDSTQIAENPEWNHLSQTELYDHFENLTRQAVSSRMVSDVPIGVFLSGGIDSSLVAALMSEQSSNPIKSYTVGFESKIYDESKHAKKIASYLGCDHNELFISRDSLLDEVETVLNISDEPLADVAALPTSILSRHASKEVKVSLTGDGGDEIFLGYPLHSVLGKYNWLHKIPPVIRDAVAQSLAYLPSRKAALFAGLSTNKSISSQYLFLRSLSRQPLNVRWAASGYLLRLEQSLRGRSPSQISGHLDIKTYLPEALLLKTDLSTMMWSLEGREPLLDHRLAEAGLSLPMNLTLGKKVLKGVLGRLIPAELWDRPKHSFDVPIDDWLRYDLVDKIQQLCEEWPFEEVLDKTTIQSLVQQHINRDINIGSLLWSMISLLHWYKKYRKWLV